MSKLYGLLGEKLGHSISPAIHSLIFKELGIEGNYNLFEVSSHELRDAVFGLKVLGAKGVNVTIPYKVSVINFLDGLSKEAEKIGAVNTICFRDGKTIGYNTDYYGFGMMLNKYDVNALNKNVVVLGSGGAAKSVIAYFMDNGAKNICIVSRDIEKTKLIYNNEDFHYVNYDKLKYLKGYDILVNCTPCGMYPNVEGCSVDKTIISNFNAVVDLIYNPSETVLLKYAKENGIKAINGLYMLVGQAIAAQELWNSVKINNETVDKIYNYFVDKI